MAFWKFLLVDGTRAAMAVLGENNAIYLKHCQVITVKSSFDFTVIYDLPFVSTISFNFVTNWMR